VDLAIYKCAIEDHIHDFALADIYAPALNALTSTLMRAVGRVGQEDIGGWHRTRRLPVELSGVRAAV
jgi:hypothetical protein